MSEVLALYPDRVGGLYTSHARPDAAFLATLGNDLSERIARWARDFKDPHLLGYDAPAVKCFDYAAHLAEGMAMGETLAPLLPEGGALEIAMPSAESIAANSTRLDTHVWNGNTHAWEFALSWRDRLSPDWFGPEPACPLRQLRPR